MELCTGKSKFVCRRCQVIAGDFCMFIISHNFWDVSRIAFAAFRISHPTSHISRFALHISHSTFRIPHSSFPPFAFHIPHTAILIDSWTSANSLSILHSAFHIPYSISCFPYPTFLILHSSFFYLAFHIFRFKTFGDEALSFNFFKYGSPDPDLLRDKDMSLKLRMSSVQYVHTKRFQTELVVFFQHYLQLQEVLGRMRAASEGNEVVWWPISYTR